METKSPMIAITHKFNSMEISVKICIGRTIAMQTTKHSRIQWMNKIRQVKGNKHMRKWKKRLVWMELSAC